MTAVEPRAEELEAFVVAQWEVGLFWHRDVCRDSFPAVFDSAVDVPSPLIRRTAIELDTE